MLPTVVLNVREGILENLDKYFLIHKWKFHSKNFCILYFKLLSVFVCFRIHSWTFKLILWKSDKLVLINLGSWKDFGLLVTIKSMQVGFIGFLKQVLSLTTFFATVYLTKIIHGNIIWFYIENSHKNKVFILP